MSWQGLWDGLGYHDSKILHPINMNMNMNMKHCYPDENVVDWWWLASQAVEHEVRHLDNSRCRCPNTTVLRTGRLMIIIARLAKAHDAMKILSRRVQAFPLPQLTRGTLYGVGRAGIDIRPPGIWGSDI